MRPVWQFALFFAIWSHSILATSINGSQGSTNSGPCDQNKEITTTTTTTPIPLTMEVIAKKTSRDDSRIKVPKRIMTRNFNKSYNPPYEDFVNYIRLNYQNLGKITFNIYNESHKNATVTFFEMLKYIDGFHNIQYTTNWAKENMDQDMYDYALRLAVIIYKPFENVKIQPPFILKKHFLFNEEVITKALKARDQMHVYTKCEEVFNQMNKIKEDKYAINANYSGWQYENKDSKSIKYFTEDFELNSYYYGVHLMFPYWMTNEEMNEVDERFAEHYFFVHKQLMARYKLELQQFTQQNISFNTGSGDNFDPQLMYLSGMQFQPRLMRKTKLDIYTQSLLSLKATVINDLKNGRVTLNGVQYLVTDENHIEVLTKYLRDRFDGPATAPRVRSALCGCTNEDNVFPSAIQQPLTTLRDPLYWIFMKEVLNYFHEYQEKMLDPYDLSKYETNDYKIIQFNHTKLVTRFDYFSLWLFGKPEEVLDIIPSVYARQRRLSSLEIKFNITVRAKKDGLSVVRLFLGPPCAYEKCWEYRDMFFELDKFKAKLKKGINHITWSPDFITYSSANHYTNEGHRTKEDNYNMYLFPMHLILPKGTVDGLKAVLFVMITDADKNYGHYRQLGVNGFIYYVDKKPLGFPFHRGVTNFRSQAPNYRFYDTVIHHSKSENDGTGFFSPYLY